MKGLKGMRNRNSERSLPWATSVAFLCASCLAQAQAQDQLPSWNEGGVKQAIVDFVAQVSDEDGNDYVPPAERIAVFDNDGTLWCEQPTYGQVAFILDQIAKLASDHPEWKTEQPFQAVLEGDMEAVAASGRTGLLKLATAAQSGMTAEEFDSAVNEWARTAQHPRFHRLYTRCVYQPQLELLEYLKSKGFKTFIVSGGGVAFMRPWTAQVYGLPRERVVGSRMAAEYQVEGSKRVVLRQPRFDFVNDKEGKVVGIYQHIGLRPILAFGNSDGDFQMLEYTTGGTGARLGLIVHHTDGEREYAYDRDSRIGRLRQALDEADENGWVVVDMKRDWKQVFPE